MTKGKPQRPHVLTLTDTILVGGAERLAMDLVRGTDPSRFRRTICITRRMAHGSQVYAAAEIPTLREEGVGVLELDRGSRLDLRGWLRLVRYLRAEQVDVIHAHKFGSNVWAAVLGTLCRVPVIIAHEHTWSFEGQRLRRWLDRWIVGRLSDMVIAVSEADRRRMIEIVRMPPERVRLIENGIRPAGVGDREAVRQSVGADGDTPVLVSVSVLRPQKALDVMIRAFAIVRSARPAVRLLIAGQGNRDALSALVRELDLEQAVTFLGFRRDVVNVLAAGDIAVSSSDYEGSPLAVMEYMAAGLPVVATDVGGVPRLIEHGRTGLLVPRRDPQALAAALELLLDDRGLAREMGDRGRERQQRDFSFDATLREVQALYDAQLVSAARRGSRGLRPRTGRA